MSGGNEAVDLRGDRDVERARFNGGAGEGAGVGIEAQALRQGASGDFVLGRAAVEVSGIHAEVDVARRDALDQFDFGGRVDRVVGGVDAVTVVEGVGRSEEFTLSGKTTIVPLSIRDDVLVRADLDLIGFCVISAA